MHCIFEWRPDLLSLIGVRFEASHGSCNLDGRRLSSTVLAQGVPVAINILVAVWFVAAGAGVCSALGALATSSRRRSLLLVAGSCFAVAGVLGILSIGIIFIGLSTACFIAARRVAQAEPRGASVPG